MTKDARPSPVRAYRISGTECVEILYDSEESLLAQGCNAWKATDVIMMPDGVRAVFYPKGHGNPWPLNAALPTSPQSFTETDMRKMYGAYMVWLAEQALRPPEAEKRLSLGEVIIIIIASIDGVIAGGALYYAWKALDFLRHIAGK